MSIAGLLTNIHIMLFKDKLRFVVQEHHASHLHYDFRLEMPKDEKNEKMTLKSWAVPKNIPIDFGIKRLAIQVEDHELDYINFEGIIKEGDYGAGEVKIWDSGVFKPISVKYAESGDIKEINFELFGKKLKGEYMLIKTRGFDSGKSKERSYLIFKKNKLA